MEYIKSKIRDVVDFPSKGILFKDLTTAFKDPRALHIIGWDLSQLYRDKGVTNIPPKPPTKCFAGGCPTLPCTTDRYRA